MKKVLMLGGALAQIPSIIEAKKLGYYVITCDYLPDNAGHQYADEYYNVSTTDKEAVLALARKLKIDGIVCYASDPAAPTAAYVAEKMGLAGNPYQSVEVLSNKDKFRKFLEDNAFYTPKSMGFSNYEQVEKEIGKFKLPVMVKPVDSSGSKGVSKVENVVDLKKAVEEAMSFSRAKKIIVEEFVEKLGYQIAGDGFSVDGKLVFRAFANDHFDENSPNQFAPIAASFPYNMPKEIHEKVHREIQRALTLLNMKTGAYNFDIRIDKDYHVYLMEIGPRNGGNMIPQVIQYATGVNMVEYTIKAAMGEDCSDLTMREMEGYWAYYALHSMQEGIFKELKIEKEFKQKHVQEIHLNYEIGQKIPAYTGSNGTIGLMILKFSSMDEMLEKIENVGRWVEIVS